MIGQAFEVVGFEACHDVKQGGLSILFVVLLVYGKGLIEQVLRSIILGLKFSVDTKVVLAVSNQNGFALSFSWWSRL